MVESLVNLIALPAMARRVRGLAREAMRRSAFSVAALVAGVVGLFCFTRSSLVLMERHIDPAEAWALLGVVYGAFGTVLYFAAIKRHPR
jgi:drug/metabolite transporter (DMT)-like permease